MSLKEYKNKRHFKETPEPEGEIKKNSKELKFVIQRHDATNLHFDVRLEMEGVLKSWAVPKGPSMNPKHRRLAIQTEDHPLDYLTFKGEIPEGNYGAGIMDIWDTGTYNYAKADKNNYAEKELLNGFKNGNLHIQLNGKKIQGKFMLVQKKDDEKMWFMIKERDEFATDDDFNADEIKPLKQAKKASISTKKQPVTKNKETNLENNIEIKIPLPKNVKKEKFPEKIEPMKAKLVDEPFNDKEWLFELKWDGYRALAFIEKNKVKLISRNGNKFTKYRNLNEVLSTYNFDAVIDGEIVAFDKTGRPKFQILQNYNINNEENLYFYAFDILHFNGFNFTKVPLIERKNFLEKILPANNFIKYSEHLIEEGEKYFKQAQKFKLEGVIGKEINSIYQPGKRSNNWVKIKTQLMQEGIIIGFNAPKNSRKYFGSLLLAAHKNGKLVYIGKSGGGFTEKMLEQIYEKMQPLIRKTQAVNNIPKMYEEITWLKPELVAEVSFSEWTDEGTMRHPVFKGLRPDKNAKEVIIETAENTGKIVK